jgi:hypothetical protein
MVAGPFHRLGGVLQKGREVHLGHLAVIRHDGDEAAAGKGARGKAIGMAVAGDPAAAIEEDHHRALVERAGRAPHVEPLAMGTERHARAGPAGAAAAAGDTVGEGQQARREDEAPGQRGEHDDRDRPDQQDERGARPARIIAVGGDQ